MKQLVTSFDPSALQSSSFQVQTQQNPVNGFYGYLLIANESSVSLIITIGGDQFRLPPWVKDKVILDALTKEVGWQQEFSLNNAGGAPVTQVLVDYYSADEPVSDVYPISLVRNTNIGNTVNTAMTATLINDGSPDNTVIIETTPISEASSAFSLDNRGNLILRTGNLSGWSVVIEVDDGGAGPYTALFHGLADAVRATGVQAGILPAGVDLTTINSDAGAITSDGSGNETANAYIATGTHNNGSGNYAFSGGAISFDGGAGHSTGLGTLTITGVMNASAFTPALGNGTFDRRGNFSGTGSGTVATGAGGTPRWVGITDNQAGSSMTVGVVISGTNAVVTAGASHTWNGIAI